MRMHVWVRVCGCEGVCVGVRVCGCEGYEDVLARGGVG